MCGMSLRPHTWRLWSNMAVVAGSILVGTLYYTLKVVWVDSAM